MFSFISTDMSSKVPCPARYIDGRSGSQILLDPDDFPMVYHKTEAKRKYFYCRKKKELGWKVAVSAHFMTSWLFQHGLVPLFRLQQYAFLKQTMKLP